MNFEEVLKNVPKSKTMVTKIDRENQFASLFDRATGFYMRTGVIVDGVDTGIDPFMTAFPELIDIGVMGHCVHGTSGLCMKSGVQCYQNGLNTNKPNMSLDEFKHIIDECKNKTFQVALGGRGDVDQHENFEDILKYCRDNGIVPNFTSSGLGFTPEIVDICKKYCGAVAISWYRQPHTMKAIDMLLQAGVKTSIHFVLGNNTIDEAIERLEHNIFPKGINAIIFLLHKPVGLGQESNVLDPNDPKVARFYNLIDTKKFDFKIGFDSCNVPALLNFTKNIDRVSFDTCEGGRWSMYIDAQSIALPCSFDNQDQKWGVDLKTHTIKEAWDSPQFESFRNSFRNSCPSCPDQIHCMGGCPIKRQIVLCARHEVKQLA
jgi:radical SAM protein with 4Fe4S-binding SPASM domain